MKLKALLAVAAIGGLSACSTVTEGTTQDIAVHTDPPGADCVLNREGEFLARLGPTPASAEVGKTKHDIMITCDKEGYETATYRNESDVAGMTFGNAILGGVIGWGIDSAVGADNKYESPVSITMTKTGG